MTSSEFEVFKWYIKFQVVIVLFNEKLCGFHELMVLLVELVLLYPLALLFLVLILLVHPSPLLRVQVIHQVAGL